jgi:parallel beta-helix repeat protein
MNRFPPSRIAIAALVVFAFLACVKRAEATDISGTIGSTLTISDDSRLVSDVTCAVPLTVPGANPCIAFGADHIHLRLNGHTITGPVDGPAEPNNCSFGSDSSFGVGILASGRSGVKIVGPGVVQKFERWGILLVSSDHVTVRKVTVTRNCWSGMQTSGASESNFEENVWANNAAGSHGAGCGGICLANSNKNVLHKSTFHGNGSLDYEGPPPASTAGNVDFGIGFEGSSSENVVEGNDIGGNTNGVEFFNTSSDNLVRHNIIVGNPAAQVIKTFVLANQQGADIAFRPNFTGANNTFSDNFCLTYVQGAGPATAPCPNLRTEGVEEAASRMTSPLNGEKGSNDPRTAPSIFQMAFAITSFLAVALGLGLLCTRDTV